MKKLAGLLSVVMLLTMLSGCYKSETTFDFGVNGNVEVTTSLVADKGMYEAAGMASADEMMETFSEENIEMYSSMYGMKETGKRVSMVRIDGNGNEIGEGAALPEDGSMIGTKLTMQYDSMTAAANSFTLLNYLRTTPLSQDESGYGLKVEEKRTLLGAKYVASGKISVYGPEMYKAEYDAADEAKKAAISGAVTSVTFKFPLAFSKSNADSKGFLGSSLTWTATGDAPDKEVYFEVTVLNPLILAMAILILILLVIIIVMAAKRKKDTPDAYFVDEEGNPIPVYDTEGEEDNDAEEVVFEEGEEEVEGIEEVAEEVTEIIEEAVQTAEEVIGDDEEEKTE